MHDRSSRLCKVERQLAKVPEVDFANLSADNLWSIFETKAYYGGTIAYGVLSRANKLGCSCGVSLKKTKDGRKKQLESWITWSSKFCNLHWAKRIAFEIVSVRSSFKNHLTAVWQSNVPVNASHLCCSEVKWTNTIFSRVASLAVDSNSADWIDQLMLCLSDARQCVIPALWSEIKEQFVCNVFWTPSYNFTFSHDVESVDPSSSCQTDFSWNMLSECWSRILLRMRRIVSSPVKHCEPQVVWTNCVCNHAFEIPVSERTVMMWIWLLWSSNPLPTFLKQTLWPPAIVLDSQHGVEERLNFLENLRSKRRITREEFLQKRQCVMNSF